MARLAAEFRAEFERLTVRQRRRLSLEKLLRELETSDLDTLWRTLGARPYPALTKRIAGDLYDTWCPQDRERILKRAEDALAHRIEILGSGKLELGEEIDWTKDYKTGYSWPARYFRDIEYANLELPCDVKYPWELSRLQWLIPAGQAYLLTGEEKYAEAVKNILHHWIKNNPYAGTVNWACTMETALRILTWTWFFHVFHQSRAWRDSVFRQEFLRALFLHAVFTERHIERSDVNGNHYTADAAGLVFAGLFFGQGWCATRWQRSAWDILTQEIERQVYPDGVDFEASIAYHRLVSELFLLPALYRGRLALPVSATYRERLVAMAKFTACYIKPDGTAPLWGDADDGRALPFGGQGINDHRYLIAMVGVAFQNRELVRMCSGSRTEMFWLLGESAVASLPSSSGLPMSTGFSWGGFYVMRGKADHVFIDCGPVGLAGRGGHGHNDCLAFEAVLDGVSLISDCGAYLYTASYVERNAFRSTAYHNTPQIDGKEINRFIRPDYLWNLHYDAIPEVLQWQHNHNYALFVGQHRGYTRGPWPVVPRRTILLDFAVHGLFIQDRFEGDGEHTVTVPMHLAPGVDVVDIGSDELFLIAGSKRFRLWWRADSGYVVDVESGRVSPSYGVLTDIKKLVWRREADILGPLDLFIAPSGMGHDFELRVLKWPY